MVSAEIRVRSHTAGEGEVRELEDSLLAYLGSLARNDQMWGEEILWQDGKDLVAHLNLARPDAIEKRRHSPWGLRELDRLTEQAAAPPAWKLLEVAEPRYPHWESAKFLYLFTSSRFALRRGRTRGQNWIPNYLLPISEPTRDGLGDWSRLAAALDEVYLHSGPLEKEAENELVSSESDLAKMGRSYCAEIEEATGKPTYYYIHRRGGEGCPECGGKWHRPDFDPTTGLLECWCEGCRLTSDLPVDGP